MYLEAVGPDGWLWDLQSAGSPPHEIRPRRAKALAFVPRRGGVRAARARRARRARGEVVFAAKVDHPGFKGKKLNEKWLRHAKPVLWLMVQRAKLGI